MAHDKNIKKKTVVSIVTVCKNAGPSVEKTILSVVRQDFAAFEYILIDGLSDDGTPEVIAKHRSAIDVFVSEKDTGIYNAMNKAVERASGEWILFMNAGDYFVDDAVLQKAARLFGAGSDVVYGDIIVEKNGEPFLKESPGTIKNIHRMPFCHQAVFTRTRFLKKYPFDEKYRLSSDYKFFKRLILDNVCFQKIDIPVTVYDLSGLSNSQRTRGLSENVSIIKELDSAVAKWKFLPRLYWTIFWNKIRNK